MDNLELPVTFRFKPIHDLVGRVRAGESCSVIGVGDVGKSNVARHLKRLDVRNVHWGSDAPGVIYLYVDCNKLTQFTGHALDALIIKVAAETLKELGGAWGTLQPVLETHWRTAVTSNNDALAHSELEQAVRAIFDAGATQIIIALDDFDQVIEADAPIVLKGLRALRDDFKLRIVYAPFTRKELAVLAPAHTPGHEAFSELILSHIVVVPPYLRPDALFMLERLATRQTASPRALSDAEKERLWEITGGHGGLLRAAFFTTQRGAHALDANVVKIVGETQAVRETCDKILASLEPEEREDLIALAQRRAPAGRMLTRLARKGLVKQTPHGGWTIFAPLFENYLATLTPAKIYFVLDGTHHTVSVDYRIIALSHGEYALLALLCDKRPQPVPRQEMLARVMNVSNPHAPRPPQQRLDFYLAQLKNKIDPPGKPYLIIMPDAARLIDEDGN